MKRTLSSLLLLFLLSCGISPKQSHNIVIHTTNGTSIDAVLLYPRTSGLVIDDYTPLEEYVPSANPRVVSFDTISSIEGVVTPGALGGLVGCLLGGGLGFLIGEEAGGPAGHGSYYKQEAPLGCAIGGALGAATGVFIEGINDKIVTIREGGMEYLRSISYYKGSEPEELKKIR